MSTSYSFSTQPPSLQRLKLSALPNDFTFIVDGNEYKCRSDQISLISKKIFTRMSNPSLEPREKYEYIFKGLKDPRKHFEIFMKALNGESIEINEYNCFFMNYLTKELEIKQLLDMTKKYEKIQLSEKNALSILLLNSENGIIRKDAISFVADKWNSLLDKKIIFQLPYEAYEAVFRDIKFKKNSANSHFKFISDLVNNRGSEFQKLYKFVKFNDLQTKDLCTAIDALSIDSISDDFFNSLEQRFCRRITGDPIGFDNFDDDEEEDEEEDLSQFAMRQFNKRKATIDISDILSQIKPVNQTISKSQQSSNKQTISQTKENQGKGNNTPVDIEKMKTSAKSTKKSKKKKSKSVKNSEQKPSLSDISNPNTIKNTKTESKKLQPISNPNSNSNQNPIPNTNTKPGKLPKTQQSTQQLSNKPSKSTSQPNNTPSQLQNQHQKTSNKGAQQIPVSNAPTPINFPYHHEYNEEFCGVFNYFVSKRSLLKNIEIECGGDKQNMVHHLFEYDKTMFQFHWDSFSHTDGASLKNAWYSIFFLNHAFKLTHYTLASSQFVKGKVCPGIQPRSWKLEACVERGAPWETIASEVKSELLQASTAVATFPALSSKFYKGFRLQLIENASKKSCVYYNQLKLNGIEFYGVLMPA
ncbi:hypothetical protein TRFO_43123 [Tritrichomonas foetus]|uniref:Uncharacterized protein n=1 Tax=Tritrichomonas foetus TaxID=1144522 RepID=A0A1J4KX62_9EUKA|nr:hypothetical protein TRFO_43123 [Tritrichomonas foetus]|eukprot:OHT14294.1 hypothetical protein TRFO_43123 [Tritrichomonas foetus]